jgi:hypothetical protein
VRSVPLAGVLLAVAAVLGGCGLWAGSVTAPVGPGTCANVLEGACQEQIDRTAARHPGVTNVDVACTVPHCDRKGGAGTLMIALADGTTVKEAFTYTGDPGPVPVPTCTGMAPDLCGSIATSTVDGLPPSKAIRAISIACTASACTQDRGEADVRVQFSDGSEFQGSQGWEPASG